jgi:hypothetical protein
MQDLKNVRIGTEGGSVKWIHSPKNNEGVALKGHPIWCRTSDQLFSAQLPKHRVSNIIQEITMSTLPGRAGFVPAFSVWICLY